jgi:hypothetical protein
MIIWVSASNGVAQLPDRHPTLCNMSTTYTPEGDFGMMSSNINIRVIPRWWVPPDWYSPSLGARVRCLGPDGRTWAVGDRELLAHPV